MKKIKIKKTLKEWEMQTGILLKKIKIKNKKCTESAFKKLINKKEIVIRTEKGLKYWEELRKWKIA